MQRTTQSSRQIVAEDAQAAEVYESRVVEHGIDAVKTGYKGHAADPDLLSGTSRNVAELSDAVINALNCTVEAGGYVIKTGTSHSNVWGSIHRKRNSQEQRNREGTF